MTDPLASAKFAMHAEAYHILLSYVGVDTLIFLTFVGRLQRFSDSRRGPSCSDARLVDESGESFVGEWQVLQEFMLIIPDCRNAGGCARQKVRNCKH